ncbi:MAG: HAD family hydrolase [Promethearchaeota archaeon]
MGGDMIRELPFFILFFDLDQTLVKISRAHEHFDGIIVDCFKEFKLRVPSLEERDNLWRDSHNKSLLKDWGFKDNRLFWECFDRLDYAQRKKMIESGEITIFPDVKQFFENLEKFNGTNRQSDIPFIYKVILSNTSKEIAEYELKTFDIHRYFDEIYALGNNEADLKPSPNIINQIIKKFGNPNKDSADRKKRFFMIGDSHVDVEAAHNAGITSILINRKKKDVNEILRKYRALNRPKPDKFINNLAEFGKLLVKIIEDLRTAKKL